MEKDGFERIRHQIHYDHVFVVPHHNKGGSLALFWKNEISVAVQNSSVNHIDIIVDRAYLLLCFMYVVSTLPPRP